MAQPKNITNITELSGLAPEDRERLRPVMDTFAFLSNEYYLSLINWDDPDDPIRKVIVPCEEELQDWGHLDPSNESKYSVMQGVQHKYESTAVFLASDACGGYCRFCFRKRLFIHPEQREFLTDVDAALDYVRDHPEINNVLITGGDGLMLPTARLERIVAGLREIHHVRIIRVGTKLMAYNPYRVLDDPELVRLVERYSLPDRRMYFMLHFNHPREITEQSIAACNLLHRAGAVLCNQTPMLRGVNDSPEVLGELFNTLSFIGVPPYYVFLCRPTVGNLPFAVPIEQAHNIFLGAKSICSGLAKRARLTMSHATGKIEVLASTSDQMIFRYHRAASPEQSAEVVICKKNPEAYWFDDYQEIMEVVSLGDGSSG
ncbi:KamA family radical SAM protein [Desulfonatronum thioautotrophicum]|uniref:KamA family radical SAM protein n=1 Tax=Desulfonatronum thioautotrophicum TaxID=617001 RepID=UPI0005EB7596|nr:KamA family radical SAM protein [Desulfonatronum thioautotrophicum]